MVVVGQWKGEGQQERQLSTPGRAQQCCDTCANFVLVPGLNELNKRWGWCNAPVPPWAAVFLSVAGREVSKVQVDYGAECDVFEDADMPSPAPLPQS